MTLLDRPWLRLAAWSAFLVLCLRLLHGPTLGTLSPPAPTRDAFAAWVDGTSPVVMALTLVRLAALAATWYLVAATVLTVAAALSRRRGLTALATAVSPRFVQRLVSRSAGAGLAVGALLITLPLPPRLAASEVVAAPVAGDATADAATRGEAFRGDAGGDPPAMATMTRLTDPVPPAAPGPPEAAEPVSPARWVVEPGDSFWSIAADSLADDRVTSDTEIARYWQALIDANRDRLVDKDNPDLLLPGQELLLPPA